MAIPNTMRAFGLLANVHWPHLRTKIGDTEIVRFDHLPEVTRYRVNNDYLAHARSCLSVPMSERFREKAGSRSVWPVLEKHHRRTTYQMNADPMRSQHFLVTCPTSSHGVRDSIHWDRLSAVMACLRMIAEEPISLVAPVVITDNELGSGMMFGSGRELEFEANRWGAANIIFDKAGVRACRKLLRRLVAEPSLSLVCRRLNMAMGRESAEDRLLDLNSP